MSPLASFRSARDLLIDLHADHTAAVEAFRWPRLDEFNWALDWFDHLAAVHGDQTALRVIDEDGGEEARSFASLSTRSNQVANFLRRAGVNRGDPLLMMLGNVVPLWEVMLASMKLGAVIVPASTLLSSRDLADRIERGHIRGVITEPTRTASFAGQQGDFLRFVAGGEADGWISMSNADLESTVFEPAGVTRSSDPLFRYFTSGTTSKPKLVEHTHTSYPVGHLSTMYWIGLRPGDVHLNLSSPGWAKHAWSSLFAPWNAEATVVVYNFERFNAVTLLDILRRCDVTTFCAPPTVWRTLMQHDLTQWKLPLREAVAAGEPLNPEVIETVRRAWGLTIRDGFGQTETTALVGNSPGLAVKPGSMGRPLPGYRVMLLNAEGNPAGEGEIGLDLAESPVGVMSRYLSETSATTSTEHIYRTGDIAARDADGYLTYIGRADDVFKVSDYRVSPFELESVLIEHEAVTEAAVVPSPDPLRLAVPKAFVTLTAGYDPDAETAKSILSFCRDRLAPFKRVRRLEFRELPKTVSGKIRRVDLRTEESSRVSGDRRPGEHWEDDFQ